MSTLVTKNVQVGTSATTSQNFLLYQPSTPDGTARIAYGASGSQTDVLTVTNGGNVGIGTTSPAGRLDVSGADDTIMYFRNATANIRFRPYVPSYATSQIAALNAAGSAYAPLAVGGSYTVIESSGVERIRVDASGNVGIGTNSPGAKLQVNANTAQYSASVAVRTAGNQYEFGHSNTAGYGSVIGAETGSGAPFVAFNCGAGTNINTYRTYGIAGVVLKTDNAGAMLFASATNTNADNQSLTERMRIDSSGNLLVGTTSTINVSTSNITGCQVANYGTLIASANGAVAGYFKRYTSTGDLVQFFYSTTFVGSISTNGNTTTYGTTSDYRLKHDIQPMTGALEKVAALKPVTYKWKADGSDGEGFIAHELQEVVPQAVTGEKDAVDENGNPVYQGIDTSHLVATLTAAIQELKAELDTVKAELQSLKG